MQINSVLVKFHNWNNYGGLSITGRSECSSGRKRAKTVGRDERAVVQGVLRGFDSAAADNLDIQERHAKACRHDNLHSCNRDNIGGCTDRVLRCAHTGFHRDLCRGFPRIFEPADIGNRDKSRT